MSELTIERHLANWGLRAWPDEASYHAWQRQALSEERLRLLQHTTEQRRAGGDARADQALYDLAASPDVLPVLHSQRYGYYQALGPAVANRLDGARRVLDVGCGVGILITWYAARFPAIVFLGLDRSRPSLEAARRFAEARRLKNVSFQECDVSRQELPAGFDTIVATQALFQSETDPGLPSRHWATFERDRDTDQQRRLEQRTGIGLRLDRVAQALGVQGRIVLFEKAAHCGRRVLFQRALGARGFAPVESPRLLTYAELGESVEDGPLYVLRRGDAPVPALVFDETVTPDPQRGLYRCPGNESADFVYARLPKYDVYSGVMAENEGARDAQYEVGRTGGGLGYVRLMIQGRCEGLMIGPQSLLPLMVELIRDEWRAGRAEASRESRLTRFRPEPDGGSPEQVPVYENHSPAAEDVWRTLPDRVVLREQTDEEEDGRQRHIEYGRCAGNFHYLYWANTYDQRQMVIVDHERRVILEAYYAESVGER